MNLTIQLFLWCCLQVTLLAVAALVFNSLFARRRPAAGAVIAASALFAVVGLTRNRVSAPGPAAHLNWEQVSWRSPAQAEDDAVDSTEPRPVLRPVVAHSSVGGADVQESEAVASLRGSESTWQRVSVAAARDGLFALSVVYLAGLAVMMVRIAWGLVAVRGYRRDSSMVTDRRLLEFVDVICAELSCGRPIEVRESPD